jgi:hypothetical protein
MPSSYFSRTVSVSGNRRTWTFSTWVKRSALTSSGSYQTLFSSDQTSTNSVRIKFDSSPDDTKFEIYYYTGTMQLQLATNRLFRDTSAWYHIVVAVDTTQATSSNRAKIYVNGVQETSLAIATYPSQNTDTSVNQSTAPHQVGNGGSNLYFDGSMASTYLIDGTALDATSFGETDATTGIWKPKSYSGSYGTNGFFLKFENSASLGTDSSGNGNNFTVNGTPTQTVDTPSNVFATINPLIGNHSNGNDLRPTFSNGNLTTTATGSAWRICQSTLAASSGKYYAEFKWVSDSSTRYAYIGIYDQDNYVNKRTGYPYVGDLLNSHSYSDDGLYWVGGVSTSFGDTYNVSVIGVAMDLNNSKVYFSKNGVWQGSGNPSSGTGGKTITANKIYMFGFSIYSTGSLVISSNFGNGVFGTTAITSPYSDTAGLGKFQYEVPTGYYALCTKNINVYG